MPLYEVSLITREQVNYLVEADSPGDAEALIRAKATGKLPYGRDGGITLGDAWSSLVEVHAQLVSGSPRRPDERG